MNFDNQTTRFSILKKVEGKLKQSTSNNMRIQDNSQTLNGDLVEVKSPKKSRFGHKYQKVKARFLAGIYQKKPRMKFNAMAKREKSNDYRFSVSSRPSPILNESQTSFYNNMWDSFCEDICPRESNRFSKVITEMISGLKEGKEKFQPYKHNLGNLEGVLFSPSRIKPILNRKNEDEDQKRSAYTSLISRRNTNFKNRLNLYKPKSKAQVIKTYPSFDNRIEGLEKFPCKFPDTPCIASKRPSFQARGMPNSLRRFTMGKHRPGVNSRRISISNSPIKMSVPKA
ncbi:unnamed protein product [Moneuplotes crassus]|uniref:Uncharacterized protein n=1 Tax=Euplotes crassus TaxID=5936 RepID=A0AAD1XEU5_EUPCR|nr:unnamed protein product [Moneuplotes crassus]